MEIAKKKKTKNRTTILANKLGWPIIYNPVCKMAKIAFNI